MYYQRILPIGTVILPIKFTGTTFHDEHVLFLLFITELIAKVIMKGIDICVNFLTTDKTTDVWSRDFIISKINYGLWAVVWAGL